MMMFCEKCGNRLRADDMMCSLCDSPVSSSGSQRSEAEHSEFSGKKAATTARGFLESMKNRMGIGEPERNATDAYERGLNIVPDSISADDNEIPVKQYDVAILRNLLKLERAEGRMQITNKRVIFRACGRSIRGRTTLQHEFSMAEISGIEAQRNFKFSFLHLLAAILLSIVAASLVLLLTSPLNTLSFPPHVRNAQSVAQVANSEAQQARQAESDALNAEDWARQNEMFLIEEIARAEEAVRVATTEQERQEAIQWRAWAEEELIEAEEAVEWAEEDVEIAIERRQIAEERARMATQRMERTVQTWNVIIGILGIAVTVGGMLPFFLLYKRFALKLFILNFSGTLGTSIFYGVVMMRMMDVVGFGFGGIVQGLLSPLVAGPFGVLLFVHTIVVLACIILFCFVPNLVISIKNKGGMAQAVNIRRDTIFTRRTETGTGFGEILPMEEAEKSIREMGAIINDIQTLGDLGVQKWIKS